MLLLDPTSRPLIGHRGASGEYPENTLLAFDQALAQGADALELDVRVSADGIPVVIHDATVDRTTDGAGPVAGYSADALGRLDAGAGESVPLLAEVLDRYADTPLVVELKERAAGPAVAGLLRRHGAANRVLVGAFDGGALRPFARAPFARAASRAETALCWAASRLGLVPPGRFAAFTVPERHGLVTVVDRAFVRAARRRGRPVHVWTVDDPVEAARLRGLGVAGIITNFPARLRAAQSSQGANPWVN